MNTTNTLIAPKAEAAQQTYRIPSFSILEAGKRIETLEHCFMEHMLLFCPDPPASIKAKNGASYVAVYDNLILPTPTENTTIKVIVSFQKHSYGSFAVVRNFRTAVGKQNGTGETE